MSRSLLGAGVVVVVLAAALWGQQESGPEGNEALPAEKQLPQVLTVAVLDFEAKEVGGAEMGSKIADLLTIYLSTMGDFEMVERSKLKDILSEQALSLSGAVDPAQAVQAGRLVGAKLMVFGRAFALEGDLYLPAMVVSTETSRVAGALVKVKLSDELTDAVAALAEKLVETIEKRGAALGVTAARIDPVKAISQALKDLKADRLPSVVVAIPEQHLAQAIIDPAAETELQSIFKGVGCTVFESRSKMVREWAKVFFRSGEGAVPTQVKRADLLVVGEAFSEPAGRFGELHSCKARLEVKIVEKKSGTILAVGSSNTAAIDLSEHAAGKKALQKAAQNLAVRLIPDAIREWSK